jgi:hypothetical protein
VFGLESPEDFETVVQENYGQKDLNGEGEAR